jgi:hypothetical protein
MLLHRLKMFPMERGELSGRRLDRRERVVDFLQAGNDVSRQTVG